MERALILHADHPPKQLLVIPVKLITSDGRAVSLTIGCIYEVLGIEAENYRMLTDDDHPRCPNDPVLYEADCFQIIDPYEPDFWVSEYADGGERYAYPAQWARAGFFEDYHDGLPAVRTQFWNDLREFYPRTWHRRRAP